MLLYFRIYLFLIFSSFLIPILDFPLYLSNIDIVSFGKIPFILMFFTSILYHIKHNLFLPSVSKIIIFSFFIAIGSSIFYGNILSSAHISHIYALTMPIFSISIGYNFYNIYQKSDFIKVHFQKIINVSFVFSIVLSFFYIYFYFITNQWGYFGFATSMPLFFGYILTNNPKHAYFGFFVNIFTGKRSGILITLFFLIKRIKYRSIFKKPLWTLVLVFFFIIAFIQLNDLHIFDRFEMIFDLDFQDAFSIFMATGGRFTEIISVLDHLNNNPFMYFSGSGIGGKYLFVDPRSEFPNELMHYTHFSPTFYLFLIGLPLTILIYTLILKEFKYINKKEPITYIFLSFFINSFFGSIMFVDPRFWFFFGCLLGYKKFKSISYV